MLTCLKPIASLPSLDFFFFSYFFNHILWSIKLNQYTFPLYLYFFCVRDWASISQKKKMGGIHLMLGNLNCIEDKLNLTHVLFSFDGHSNCTYVRVEMITITVWEFVDNKIFWFSSSSSKMDGCLFMYSKKKSQRLEDREKMLWQKRSVHIFSLFTQFYYYNMQNFFVKKIWGEEGR